MIHGLIHWLERNWQEKKRLDLKCSQLDSYSGNNTKASPVPVFILWDSDELKGVQREFPLQEHQNVSPSPGKIGDFVFGLKVYISPRNSILSPLHTAPLSRRKINSKKNIPLLNLTRLLPFMRILVVNKLSFLASYAITRYWSSYVNHRLRAQP